MKQALVLFTLLFLAHSCTQPKEWKYLQTIDLKDITPIGLTYAKEHIWLADGDNNRIVKIDKEGIVQQEFADFERPMHLSSWDNTIYIPEYGTDTIQQLINNKLLAMNVPDTLDAPASVDVFEKEIAIADFYNHRIIYFDGNNWTKFGKEGKIQGEFYYPTDVQITADYIYVADAYNNRIQVFDKQGKFVQLIGEAEKMNAATGIFVSDQQIFVTDFENDRVLIYNLKGELQQIIEEHLNKPTDLLLIDSKLYITNYKGKNMIILK